MIEDPVIIQLNIRHYLELLQRKHHTVEARQKILKFLKESQIRLSQCQSIKILKSA
jgi:hypothetical protein